MKTEPRKPVIMLLGSDHLIANAEAFWKDEAGRNWIDFDPYEGTFLTIPML